MDEHIVYKVAGVAVYLALLVAIGVIASRRMKSVGDYFAAGKRLNFWAVAFSARATGESGWLLLGLTGMGATIGAKALWVVAGEVLGVMVAWLVLARRFRRLTGKYESLTVPDYLASRFRDRSHALRIFSALAIACFITVYCVAQIDATGQAAEAFLGTNYFVGATVGFLIVLVYIVAGGFLAVVWSDVFQGALMFVGLVVLPLVGLAALGGFDALGARLDAIDPGLTTLAGPGGWTPLAVVGVVGFTLIGLGFLGAPQIFVRFLALRDEREIGKGAAVAVTWTLLADAGAVLTGMVGRAIFVGEDLGANGQDVLPMMVNDLLPAVLIGLYIAIVLSAIMSTIDSLLLLGGSAIVRDWYQKVRHPAMPDASLVPMSRVLTMIMALCAYGIAMLVATQVESRSVFWFVLVGFYGLAATFGPTIILSLFWRRMTRNGALAAMATGFVAMIFFELVAPHISPIGPWVRELTSLPPAFLLSFLAGVVASKLDHEGRAAVADAAKDLDAAGH